MNCSDCGTPNDARRKFCGECGARLAVPCPSCGAANTPDVKFCGECGARLAAASPAVHEAPGAERRVVSVLFADLVGFTAISDRRDPEDVRELLTKYFDIARTIVGRYGGIVEKFIGDAVMAVWGTPVAREDDAERAVRAALELVAATVALGSDVRAPELRLRAGVVTGEAAVTLGAEGQGMVAGDLVNTASRVQSLAAPGEVLVGEGTRRLTEAAVAYEDAGVHELKGRSEPVHLWRAARVVAGRGGEGRVTGLEPPFVGRDAELRLIKELYHATADESRAHVLSVTGIAGIGKSRLVWEFYKYFDGLVELVWWHRGRCLPYGEGVAYWALSEMVRMRAEIAEDEPASSALTKLRACLDEVMADADERAWVEPRLAHLLGLTDRTAPDQQDLFSAWRRFFERLAEKGPAVLVFEDIHWGDAGLLDFIEYLADWSRNHPLLIITLARPELLEKRPNWGAGKRNFHSLVLEPLPEPARDALLRGLLPGLPPELRARIAERAEGVPLYAVETVRMLLDRGLVREVGNEHVLAGSVEALEVPETLHALIAARLDGLEAAERRVLENASVLGKTFSPRALATVTGLAEAELEPLLRSLVRKEILTSDDDPRSPERGQYGFMHALLQRVAYDTLSRHERKARHLAVAGYLESEGADDAEAVELVASHYLDAYRADPEAADAPAIRAAARAALGRAAERASSLAASEEAQRYFEQAAELADDDVVAAELQERAGEAARSGGRLDAAEAHFERAIGLFERHEMASAAARVSARLGEVIWLRGRIDEAVERMERSFRVLSADEPDEDLATLASQLGRLALFSGQFELAVERIEFALDIAESLGLPDVISQALNSKSLTLFQRPRESMTLLEGALRIALENDLTGSALRAYYNLAEVCSGLTRVEEALGYAAEGLELARRRGDRTWEWGLLAQTGTPLFLQGRWDEALECAASIPEEGREAASGFHEFLLPLARIHVARGDVQQASDLLESLASLAESGDLDERTIYSVGSAIVHRAEGRLREAVADGEEAMRIGRLPGSTTDAVEAMVEAADAALALGDVDKVEQLVCWCATLPPAARTTYVRAHESRLRGLVRAARGSPDAEGAFAYAVSAFRELAVPFWLAISLVAQSEWLLAEGRAAEARPPRSEARELFQELGAPAWLERLDRLERPDAVRV